MVKHISFKLMAIIAMSFIFLSTLTFADESKESAETVKEEAKTAAVREIHKHAIGLGLGQTFLAGQFEKYGDNKITTDFLYTYTASYSFDLLLNFHSSHHQYQDKEVWINGYSMSIKARTHEYDAFSPFILAGLGFYKPEIKNGNNKSDSKYTFGFNLGTGVDLRLNSKVVVGLMAHYHKPFEVKQDVTPDIVGSYAKLLLTAMYLF